MGALILLDTTIYLNILDVPGKNQDRQTIKAQFGSHIARGDYFFLPMAAILETGNHISRLSTGTHRRTYAEKLSHDVENAIKGNYPYRPTYTPSMEDFISWLQDFPDNAMRNKSPTKTTEGTSLSDHSIIKEWERLCLINEMSDVLIWSLDTDLSSYHRLGRHK